jgi:8-oxo-dGTP pyrophosphatase MutT (NUDIX family)
MKNPWTILSSRFIYQNNWIRLREDQVLTPDGKPGIYSVVETHPAIGIVALADNLDTWLVGQYRYPLKTYTWEIPEGGAHDGETLLQAGQRELIEETGISAAKWTLLGQTFTSNCFTDETATFFLAEELSIGDPAPDPTEQLQIKRLPFREAWRMVREGEIKDAMSVIALLHVHTALTASGLQI